MASDVGWLYIASGGKTSTLRNAVRVIVEVACDCGVLVTAAESRFSFPDTLL